LYANIDEFFTSLKENYLCYYELNTVKYLNHGPSWATGATREEALKNGG